MNNYLKTNIEHTIPQLNFLHKKNNDSKEGNYTQVNRVKDAEITIENLLRNVGERIKELNCLYSLSELVERYDITLDEIFNNMKEIIPKSWQYPDITCARIIFNNKEYKSVNFHKTEWKRSVDIYLFGKIAGAVEIYYLRKMSDVFEGPFIFQERRLLNAISERLGRVAERRYAIHEQQKSEEKFRAISITAQDALIMIDEENRIPFWNKAAERMFLYQEKIILGKNLLLTLIPECYHYQYNNICKRAKDVWDNGNTGKIFKLIMRDKDKNEIQVELSISFVKLIDKINAFYIIRDISYRRQVEQKLATHWIKNGKK